jgi:RNA methyltransferase, TrmH family
MITSATNPRLKLLRRLQARRGRERLGLFVCEGEDLVEAALCAGLQPVEALVDASRPALADRLSAEPVEPKLLAAVSTLGHPPRMVAVFRTADLPRLEPASAPPVGLALWRVGDPANVGALIRSAAALGPAFVCLSEGSADPTGPKALRASMGALFRVPLGTYEDAPGPRVALVPYGASPLAELPFDRSATFVLGAERDGLPDELVRSCEAAATIPQLEGEQSLNVAAAGAIALYEWRRRSASADTAGRL